ncbi:MAG: helix-turn-helix domain-containing protein [Candidatus Melainabacteria bacterium]|nr:helix-turn-helix domain-containing protein [Candidatus Melainabacteria bacterium]
MSQLSTSVQPTIKQLLATDALSEAQILCGQVNLDRPVSQVISATGHAPRQGSLVVTQSDSVSTADVALLSRLSGLILVKTSPDFGGLAMTAGASAEGVSGVSSSVIGASTLSDASLKRLIKRCNDAGIPLVLVPSYGEPGQVIEDVRFVFLRELKLASARLYSVMLSIALEEGLDGLVEAVSGWLNRPLVVETADFKVLASRNMGATPASQQRLLSEESLKSLREYKKNLQALTPKVGPQLDGQADLHISPVRLGRRLVFPIPLSELIAGYVSVMIRPQDDISQLSEYMQPLALACKVDFSHRLKDSPSFAVTQRSLLKDLLSGRSVSASDQERLERSFGFDLCDGFYVFAVDVGGASQGGESTGVIYPDEEFISCDAEGMRAFVVPYLAKAPETWRKYADDIVARIKELNKGGGKSPAVRLGAGRLVETMLELPDAYGEARQALVIGSMIHGEGEFALAYGELGVKRLLYLVFDHPELERFLDETLSPLAAYDDEWESELVDTLRVYLQQGANLNSTARTLFIHRHTLRYRLEQIADILKVDIDSQEVLLNLQIAFLIKDMKEGGKKK